MPRFEKGSTEAIEHMRKLREARKPKLAGATKGNGVGGAIGDSFKKAFHKTANVVSSAAKDAYNMDLNDVRGLASTTSPQEVVSYVNKAQGGRITSKTAMKLMKHGVMGGEIPAPPSRLPSSMFNPVGAGAGAYMDLSHGVVGPKPRLPSSIFKSMGAGFKDHYKDSDDSSSDSDDARGGRIHDCPMCHGMGIVRRRRC